MTIDGRTLIRGSRRASLPVAIVLNPFYTGLGIARSLGAAGIPVVCLTSRRRGYGNFTRYARTLVAPDSRSSPEALLATLVKMGSQLERRGVIFPTRDDDVIFLDRFRTELERYFELVIPDREAVNASLDKWKTARSAERAGIPSPRCRKVETPAELARIIGEIGYPCVLKPLSAHYWRQENKWRTVGARKAIVCSSPKELLREYGLVACADPRVIIQEMIPGEDKQLWSTACYIDRKSQCLGVFQTQKVVQIPEGVGTGCVVRCVNRPELVELTLRLLKSIGFSGVAEVEYKWDSAAREFKLIEINPRPWDQHPLGRTCGVDLVYIAYCDRVGIEASVAVSSVFGYKWVADDTVMVTLCRMMWRRGCKMKVLLDAMRGKKIFAIWSLRDPVPFFAYCLLELIPELAGWTIGTVWAEFKRLLLKHHTKEEVLAHETDS